ncbi:hypothetical protein [Isoptericola sp. NPDC057191]|uniref:hypothetical protein n=1 Tax=Isoptericola sp. NPDC057191 TaxID=3346041 RepID=UPI0036297712
MTSRITRAGGALSLVFVAGYAVAGCSPAAGESCDRGAPSVEGAVTGFLGAVAGGDTDAAERFLIEGNDVDPGAFTLLGEELDGTSVQDLLLSDDQMGAVHSVRVVGPEQGLIGTFDVYEESTSPECYAVAWGTFPEEPTPAPGESQQAQPG